MLIKDGTTGVTGIVVNRPASELNAKIVTAEEILITDGDADGDALVERGIVYVPDYIINAGGIINVAAQYLGETTGQVAKRVDRIGKRLTSVLQLAQSNGRAPHV